VETVSTWIESGSGSLRLAARSAVENPRISIRAEVVVSMRKLLMLAPRWPDDALDVVGRFDSRGAPMHMMMVQKLHRTRQPRPASTSALPPRCVGPTRRRRNGCGTPSKRRRFGIVVVQWLHRAFHRVAQHFIEAAFGFAGEQRDAPSIACCSCSSFLARAAWLPIH